MKINITIMFFLCQLTNLYSQKVEGVLIDELTLEKISFANIMNVNNKLYTYSDVDGRFSLKAINNDTIVISHINYYEKKIIKKNNNSDTTFILKPKFHELEEIIISSSENKVEKIGYKKGRHTFPLSLNVNYAIRINNKKTLKLKKIELPIKSDNKLEYGDEGLITLQIFQNINPNKIELKPLSRKFTAKVNVNKKKLIYEIKDNLIVPDIDFYVVIERVITNKTFSTKKYYGINPSIHFDSKGVKNDVYIKYNHSNNWMEYQNYLKLKAKNTISIPSPLFSLKLFVTKVE
ncbi:carboxypeptidase-like regulatory domain-containing protein [uncultured Polaribacter sp.]|uniref:carboxypeptidase-like regulatory domain-containing protein n=1 Tax=uncultured Polaribacter sp. TaxID=174711 RepID=UPI0026244DD6|nr:carboxypeptidase-like regulatory domain-containing protein [uncultured Polaribacter sp.]